MTGHRRWLLLVLAAALGSASPAVARTWDVPGEVVSIQAAIDSAASGDTVAVAAGTYHERLLIQGKALRLIGVTGAETTILQGSAGGESLLRLWNSGPLTLVQGFTFRDGGDSLTYYGGAIDCDACSGIIRENLFVANLAREGGAVSLLTGGPVELRENTFRENRALIGGGAIQAFSTHRTILEGNEFVDNHVTGTPTYAGYGGGALALWDYSPDSVVVRRNVMVANGAIQGGGGMIGYQGGALIASNTIVANELQDAPGPQFAGAGIYLHDAPETIVRSNILALNQGGYGIDGHVKTTAPVLDCNDVWQNGWGDYRAIPPGATDVSLDPRLCDYRNGNFGLAPDSPCLPLPSGGCGLIGARAIGCGEPLGIASSRPEKPLHLTVRAIPTADGSVLLEFDGAGPSSREAALIEIFDLRGRRVWSRETPSVNDGTGRLVWPAESRTSLPVARGVYFVRVHLGERTGVASVVLTR